MSSAIDSTFLAEATHSVNWEGAAEEAIGLLREYVRFPTVNDPFRLRKSELEQSPWLAGNEADAANWLAGVLSRENLQVKLIESAPGRVNVLARIEGRDPNGPPIILLSHSDVVPAIRDEWSANADPFSGSIVDGYIYGRGVLDAKGLAILHLMTIVLMNRLRVVPSCDIVLLVVADEETGGQFGAEWLLRELPDLRRGRLVLGEGGFSVENIWHGRTVHAIAVGEKGCLEIECLAEADGHHASMPLTKNAPERLVSALGLILKMKNPARITAPSDRFLASLTKASSGFVGRISSVTRIGQWMTARHLSSVPAVSAMLKDTVSLTLIECGIKGNLIPGQARAVLHARLLPDTCKTRFLERIRDYAEDQFVQTRELHYKPANVSKAQGEEFETFVKCAEKHNRGSLTVPILSPAASDCRHWRYAGVTAYGWVPFAISVSDLHGIHGPNERLRLASLRQGLELFFDVMVNLTK